jgi:hypothetical protein
VLPVDISAILDVGVDKWYSNANWPVSEEEFSIICNAALRFYGDLLEELPPNLQDIFLVDFDTVVFLVQYFHAEVVKNRSKEKSVSVLYGKLAQPFYEPDWQSRARRFSGKISKQEKLKFRIREAIRRIRFNNQLPFLKRLSVLFRKSEYWSLGVFDESKKKYLNSPKDWIETPFIEGFKQNSSRLSESQIAQCRSTITEYLENIQTSTTLFAGIEIPFDEITDSWIERLKDIYKQYNAVITSKRHPKLILVSGVGNTFNRIIALAGKRKGAHVVAFTHGNDTGRVENITQPYLEYAICNEFMTNSEVAVNFHQQQQNEFDRKFCGHTIFKSMTSNNYQKHYNQYKRGGRTISEIMLMGFPMHPQRYPYGTGEFFQFRLSAELDAIQSLREAGYRILYKAHPETIEYTSKIIAPKVDEFVTGPLETEIRRADCLLFTYPLTTTFGTALATDIPIVMLDHVGRSWIPKAYEMLKLRCVMVPTALDVNGRNTFSQSDLIEAIKQAPSFMDHSYLNQSMSQALPHASQ